MKKKIHVFICYIFLIVTVFLPAIPNFAEDTFSDESYVSNRGNVNIKFVSGINNSKEEIFSFTPGEVVNIYNIAIPGPAPENYYFKEWRNGSVGAAKNDETKAPIGTEFVVPNNDITIYAKYLRIGEDGWIQKENTFPYSSVVKITGGGRRGSGVVVGKDFILTAAHVAGSSTTKSIIPGLNLDKGGNPNGQGNGNTFTYGPQDLGLIKMTDYKKQNGSDTHVGNTVKPLTVNLDSIKGLKLTTNGSVMTKYNTGRAVGYPSRVEQSQYVAESWLSPLGNSFRLEATQSQGSWGGISGGPILNSADQVMSVITLNNRASFGGVFIDESAFQWLLNQGLKDEISRMYFTNSYEEYELKRKLIDPEGNYISKDNGAIITSEELQSVSKDIKPGYSVSIWTDSLRQYSTNEDTIMPIAGVTLYPEEFKANKYFVSFDKNSDDALGSMPVQSFIYDEKQQLSDNQFTRAGYSFSGWNTAADYSGTSYSNLDEVTNLSLELDSYTTLYAVWTADKDYSSLKASNYTMRLGHPQPTLSDFKATATDQNGDPIEVSLDFTKVDFNTAGTYDVTLSTTDGQSKVVKLTIEEKKVDTVKVTFNTGKGGSLQGKTTIDVPKGTKVTDLPKTITDKSNVEDIYFLDWYQNGKVVNPKAVTIDGDTTFTAKFGAAVYRLYNKNNGDHLLTKNKNEKNSVSAKGWKVETNPKNEYGRAAFYVPVQADSAGKKQVYRIYNPNSGEHFYTTNKSEADAAVKKGWRHETNKDYTWSSDGDIKMYREFNPDLRTAGSHNFTTDLQEHKNVVKAGWKDESKDSSLWKVLKAGF